jgi:hypothetical protein
LGARRRSVAAVIVMALVVTAAAFVVLAVTQPAASAQTSAVLTVFAGTVEIQRSHAAAFTRAQSGDQVSAGDTITTGTDTKAAITYPSGTVARLDSNTRLTISQLGRTTGGGWNIVVFQAVGKSWSRMAQLVGGSTYVVNAPNSVAAEVRGTEFEVIVETRNGSTLVRLNVFAGVVAATANRRTVPVTEGLSTTTSAGSPPTPPSAITTADRRDSFTVFNVTADSVRGKTVGVNSNRFSTAQASGVVAGARADGSTDLQFTLGWPGSRFELTVFDPAGSVYAQVASAVSPVSIIVTDAQAGVWSYQVTDLESQPGEVWWVIVSLIPDAPAKSPAAGSSSSPPATPASQGPSTPGAAATSQPGHASSPSTAAAPVPAPVTPVVAGVVAPVTPIVAGVIAPVTPIVAGVIGPVAPIVAGVVAPVTPVVAGLIAPVTPIVAAVAPVLAPVTPIVAAVVAPVAPIVAAVAPVLAPVTPIVAAVAPVLAPVTPVVAAVAAPVTPVVAAVAPLLAPVAPVVAAVAPALAPVAPIVAVVSPLLAPVPALAPLLPPAPASPPPSPPPSTPAPPPAPPGLLGGLLGGVKSLL